MALIPLPRRAVMHRRYAQRGYSLSEMLVVMAIIGILSLVAVPNFIAYQKSIRLKGSMRQFMNDLRAARALAVSRNSIVEISYTTGVPSSYVIYRSSDNGATWSVVPGGDKNGVRTLQSPVFFTGSNFTDLNGPNTNADIVFNHDGTATLPTGVTTGSITLQTKDKISKNTYVVTLTGTGKVTVN
jgi:prepilin-type N-terminal cleavage/methylation domain-containing protein